MLVSKILQEVDAELERLHTARNLIAALIAPPPPETKRSARRFKKALSSIPEATVPAVEAFQEPEAATAPTPAVAMTPTLVPPQRRGRPKGSVNQDRTPVHEPRVRTTRPPEPTALAHAVASGPVFVSAAEVARRRAQPAVMVSPKPPEQTPSEGTLEALIREVAERRTVTAA